MNILPSSSSALDARAMSDSWETPRSAFELLARHAVVPGNVLWDPFFSTGRARRYLGTAFPGHTIVHEQRDFFAWTPDTFDVIVTNPPYSIIERIVARLLVLGTPFALLIRTDSLFTSYMQDVLARGCCSVLVPRTRIGYIHPETEVVEKKTRFHSAWMLYRVPLRDDTTTTTSRVTYAQINE